MQLSPACFGSEQVLAPVGPAQWVGSAQSVLALHGPLVFRAWHVPFVLVPAPPVGEVARGDDQLGVHPAEQAAQRRLDLRILTCTRVEIGYMEDARRHDRMRLYIRR